MATVAELVKQVETGEAAKVLLAKIWGMNGTGKSVDVPPVRGKTRKVAPKRSAKVRTVAKAFPKKERAARAPKGSTTEMVAADIRTNPGTGIAGIIDRTGLERAQVRSALTQLQKAKRVEGKGGKRDMAYTVVG